MHKEPASRRHLAMQKVDQLKYDARHLKAAQENLKRKRDERRAHERNREVCIALNSNCFEKNIYKCERIEKSVTEFNNDACAIYDQTKNIFSHI